MKTTYPYLPFALLAIILLSGCGIPSVHPLYEEQDLIVKEELTGVWQRNNTSDTWHVLPIRNLEAYVTQLDDSTGIWSIDQEAEMHGDSLVITSSRVTRTVTMDGTGLPDGSVADGQVQISGDAKTEFSFGYDDSMAEKLYLVQRKGRESGIFIAGLVQIEGNLYFDFRPFTFDIDDMFHFPVHLFMKASLEDENTIVMHYFNDEWLKGLISNRQVRIRHEINREGAVLLTAPTAELREFVRRYGDIEEAYRNSQTFRRIADQPQFDFEME